MSAPTSNKKGDSHSQSANKVFQIMECLANNRMPMRLQDLSKNLNMTQPTVLRYLSAMIQSNYMFREEETSRYGLTMKICRISQNIASSLSMRNFASPLMNPLANRLNMGIFNY